MCAEWCDRELVLTKGWGEKRIKTTQFLTKPLSLVGAPKEIRIKSQKMKASSRELAAVEARDQLRSTESPSLGFSVEPSSAAAPWMDSGGSEGGRREASVTQSARARMWLLQVPGWAALLDQREAEYKVKNGTDPSGGYAVDKLVMGKSQKYCGCKEAGGRSWCREPG